MLPAPLWIMFCLVIQITYYLRKASSLTPNTHTRADPSESLKHRVLSSTWMIGWTASWWSFRCNCFCFLKHVGWGCGEMSLTSSSPHTWTDLCNGAFSVWCEWSFMPRWAISARQAGHMNSWKRCCSVCEQRHMNDSQSTWWDHLTWTGHVFSLQGVFHEISWAML